MESLEIFQVAVEEGIFVIPLDLQRHSAVGEDLDVIDFMRLRLALNAVDDALNDKIVLPPAVLLQRIAEPLRPFGLAAAGADDLFTVDESKTSSSCAATSGKSTPRMASA